MFLKILLGQSRFFGPKNVVLGLDNHLKMELYYLFSDS